MCAYVIHNNNIKNSLVTIYLSVKISWLNRCTVLKKIWFGDTLILEQDNYIKASYEIKIFKRIFFRMFQLYGKT